MTKTKQLIQWFKKNKKGYLLFSGGFDSSAVLGAAVQAKSSIIPLWIDNGLGRASKEEVQNQANKLGADNLEIVKMKLSKTVIQNPYKRCYFCKAMMLSNVPKGAKAIFDGTTVSDLCRFRPGHFALEEYQVLSPLAELKIKSEEAREIALELGADASLAHKESCIATRINYNYFLTPERIEGVRNVENFVINHTGDFEVRCRIDDVDHIRIELSKPESYLALADQQFREQLFDLGKEIGLFVTVDVKRSRPNEYDKRI